jgi:hypothetical protein
MYPNHTRYIPHLRPIEPLLTLHTYHVTAATRPDLYLGLWGQSGPNPWEGGSGARVRVGIGVRAGVSAVSGVGYRVRAVIGVGVMADFRGRV